MTVAYFDLDDFKRVNDQFGHAVGDAVLTNVAITLRAACRSVDTVARLGGDEFATVFPETEGAEARGALQRIQVELQRVARTHGWPVSFSIGAVVVGPRQPRPSCDELVQRADTLMYEVKRSGKNALRIVEEALERSSAVA